MKKSDRTALLEIGVEEIPARFLPGAVDQLRQNARDRFEKNGIHPSNLLVAATPRRLALIVRGVPSKAPDRIDEIIGPPPKAAKDPQGKWTQAAVGFARSQKTHVDKLQLKETPKGERYVARRVVKGRQMESVLQAIFPELIASFSFPKSMVWEPERFRFARPIRWIVALLNSRVVRFQVARVKSDKTTHGLMALGDRKIPVSRPERYLSLLQGRCILGDPDERRKKILSQVDGLAKKVKARPVLDEEHLSDLVYLTEYPTSLMGQFPERYLGLPREVLIRVMRNHQKFIPLQHSSKKLTNSFIGVRNGPSDSQDDVRDGYERVLNARLADAQFFFEADKKTSLESFAQKLSGLGFIEGLGTVANKVDRVKALSGGLARSLKEDASILGKLERAASLSKSDLLTQIVGEFPELQGMAGRFYALIQGEDPEVAEAIETHYWPLTAEGEAPKGTVAGLLSVADKMDTLAAQFYAGHVPTGSADPYALRRQAVGVIRILFDRAWPFSIPDLVERAFSFDAYQSGQKKEAVERLEQFMVQRLFQWLAGRKFRNDEIEAVLSRPDQSIPELVRKLEGFQSVRGRPEFASLAAAIKRARNILRQAQSKGIAVAPTDLEGNGHLTESAEKSLWAALQEIRPKVDDALQSGDYDRAFLELASLKEPVDAFFDGVMVMVEDESIRNRRLALLYSVESLFNGLADFSKLQVSTER